MTAADTPPPVRPAGTLPTLVVGGGIGGLSAALAVARAGRAVHVVERADQFVELGAGIQLAANATRVLAGLGVLGDVEAVSVAPHRLVMRHALTGDPLTALDVGARYRGRYGFPYLVVHRNDLLTVLLEHCQAHPRVTIETGRTVTDVRTVTDLRTGAEHAEVECEDGGVHRADAVVGADGVHSRLRTHIAADEVVHSGHATYRRLAPPERDIPPDVQVWVGPELHLVQYPVRRHELFNQAAVFRSPTFGTRPDWGGPDELDAAFADACAPVRTAVAELDRNRHWPVQDREPLPHWVDGRLALLGDAAHPMQQYLAQGACQAMEDAFALATALGPATGDAVPAALRAYQDVRLPRATRCQRAARVWGGLWHTTDPLAVALRDRVLRQRRADDYSDTDWLYARPDPTRPALAAPPPRPTSTSPPGAARRRAR
ncbi:monooxygenase FAD-binding [Parafrankia sp. EAN1pec]|uniref:FAD-dependent monooxygenase n=1 Tax=Parafrankia sp. (strain EAN1pec) TaxID=298653 RepID=UPI00015D9E99|nr:monooxygenase FAD-binding [Frankia sp. EAN1pec]